MPFDRWETLKASRLIGRYEVLIDSIKPDKQADHNSTPPTIVESGRWESGQTALRTSVTEAEIDPRNLTIEI